MTWPQTSLGAVANFINGYAFKPSHWESEGKPIIRIQNLTDPSKPFNKTNFQVDERYRVKAGDLLVSWSATLDVFEWKDEDALLNQHIFKVVPDYSKVDKGFFLYALKRSIDAMKQFTRGSTMKHINRGDFLSIQIPLPPLAEQKRISATLDKADAIRRKRCLVIQLTDEFLQSVFLDMFGDPVSNPRNWKIRQIEDIGVVQGGLQLTPKREGYPIELPYLRVANVFRNKLDLREIKIIKVTETEFKRALLNNEDILIVEGHGNREEVGRSAIWDGSIEQCTHQNHLIRLRINRKIALPKFVSTFLNSSGGRRQLFRYGKTTSGLNTISTSNVKKTEIFLPPLELQKQFVNINDTIEKLRGTIRLIADQQNLILKSLSQRAFRGDL